MAKKLPIPNGKLMNWLLANPDALPEAVRTINSILALESRVVPAGTYVQGRSTAVLSETNMVLPIPVGFNSKQSSVDDYTAATFGATYNTTVRTDLGTMSTQVATLTTAFNALIIALQQANINPR